MRNTPACWIAAMSIAACSDSTTPGDTPFANPTGIRGGKANATYVVQRAPKIGWAQGERAFNLEPWSSADTPAAAFPYIYAHGGTGLATNNTSTTGDGMIDFEFRAPMILKDASFDVMFRLIDDAAAPSSVLLSQCLTVTPL